VLKKLALPERFELPTPWFVGRRLFDWSFRINKLDGPPSPNLSPRLAESRRERIQPYAIDHRAGPHRPRRVDKK